MGIIQNIILVILVLAFVYVVVSAVWWTFLWSFNFPITFAWKQTIGIFAASLLFGGIVRNN